MKHIRSFSDVTIIGSMSAIVVGALSGCTQTDDSINQNKFVIVKEIAPNQFTVIEEQAINGPTRVVVKSVDGSMRELTPSEIQTIANDEYKKVEDGTSEAIQNNNGGGMGLGSTILAVAAGSILGNMIANQLMGNKNFQRNNRAASSHARAFKRDQRSGSRKSTKKGFFGRNSAPGGTGGMFGG